MPADDLHAALRLAVHGFRSTQRRRVFAPVLHAGSLGGEHLETVLDAELRSRDSGMRTDLAVAMLARAAESDAHPAVWLTRTGTPHPQDLDLDWVPAIRRACDILGIEPLCVVVLTKAGWFDPFSGERAEWARLRIRPREMARLDAVREAMSAPDGARDEPEGSRRPGH